MVDKKQDYSKFVKEVSLVEQGVFELVAKHRGSISAEHGIGLLKKSHLKYSRSEVEIEWMRKIKSVFDPSNILNPGKIL